MILGRRDPTSAAETAAATDEEPAAAGKGRPTPKRSEARKARRGAAPSNRKEATAQQRERNREARMRARQALITGDERHLPPRDAGPERRLARDVVDSRFSLGQAFMIVIAVAFLTSTIPNKVVGSIASLASLLALTIIVVDSALHGRRAKLAVTERYGVAQARGISSYAFLRAMLPRRFRRPPPKVARGGAAL
ncbi:MAG TPA: DUF3043 domain-containing protein [Mycobacteriales bacterium]|nr:DUF3043 domain-containing protein [Mycobacteriales bacterium]